MPTWVLKRSQFSTPVSYIHDRRATQVYFIWAGARLFGGKVANLCFAEPLCINICYSMVLFCCNQLGSYWTHRAMVNLGTNCTSLCDTNVFWSPHRIIHFSKTTVAICSDDVFGLKADLGNFLYQTLIIMRRNLYCFVFVTGFRTSLTKRSASENQFLPSLAFLKIENVFYISRILA